MKGFVAVTDNDWFAFLSQQPEIDEVNFWQPGGTGQFRALNREHLSQKYSLENCCLLILNWPDVKAAPINKPPFS